MKEQHCESRFPNLFPSLEEMKCGCGVAAMWPQSWFGCHASNSTAEMSVINTGFNGTLTDILYPIVLVIDHFTITYMHSPLY